MGKKNRCKPYKLQNTWNMPNIHNRNFFSSLGLNKWTYNKYWVQLLDLTLALFKYDNLPDTIDPRFMELVMIAQGSVLLSEDQDFKVDESDSGHIATMWNYNGSLNIYGIPNKRHAWAYGGYNRNLTNKDSVIMWDKFSHMPTIDTINYYAQKLWEWDNVINVNMNAQKTPLAILTNEEDRQTWLNIYAQYDGNVPIVFGAKSLDLKEFTVLKTDAPFIADKIQEMKKELWYEALTEIGIRNMNIGKKERLVQDEARNSLGDTNNILVNKLQSRRNALEEYNKMKGLNITVEVNENILTQASQIDTTGILDQPVEGDE